MNQEQIEEEEEKYQDWVDIVNDEGLNDDLDRDLKLQSTSIPNKDFARSKEAPSQNGNEIDDSKAGLNQRIK